MKDLAVIVPSRGRPGNCCDLIDAWGDTYTEADLIFGVDHDDPSVKAMDAADGCQLTTGATVRVIPGSPVGMAGTLNNLAREVCGEYRYIGFMGDDHRPRTRYWDATVVSGLDDRVHGIGYGDDLIHGQALPTAAVVSSSIVQVLGWIAPPALRHLYLDNFWLTFGEALGSLRYFPDVVIEHLHPIAGRAEWDEGYERVNAGAVQAHDRAEFERWMAEDMARDVEQVRASTALR